MNAQSSRRWGAVAGDRIDREHDAADRRSERQIHCPTLVLWSEAVPLSSWYAEEGGPLALWRGLAPRLTGHAVAGGHFFCEEHPADTARTLRDFLRAPGEVS